MSFWWSDKKKKERSGP